MPLHNATLQTRMERNFCSTFSLIMFCFSLFFQAPHNLFDSMDFLSEHMKRLTSKTIIRSMMYVKVRYTLSDEIVEQCEKWRECFLYVCITAKSLFLLNIVCL